MKKICSECKHWRRNYDQFNGSCKCEKFIYTHGEDMTEPDQFEYWDYEGYSAGFQTGEAFGCIHWRGKND